VKPSLSVDDQVALLGRRGLTIDDETFCSGFFSRVNYYRFSGYARYFQRAPHLGDNVFVPGTTFAEIVGIYDADENLRTTLGRSLTATELLLRTHFARVVADQHGPYGRYLEAGFYTDAPELDADRRPLPRRHRPQQGSPHPALPRQRPPEERL
jgi:abortive infection bacteriophage resistance protein